MKTYSRKIALFEAGEAVDQNSLLTAVLPIAIGIREVDEGDGPRYCG
jgi:hypothetical protein